jgi:hypothetical protein
MRIRMHRGGLDASMATMIETNDISKVFEYLKSNHVDTESLTCSHYADDDSRIGWKPVYIVCDKNGVAGFTDYFISKRKC